jgi:hypothetical protein
VRSGVRIAASAIAALALVTSTAVSAAPPPTQAAVQPVSNPWMKLSMMTPVAAATLGAAGVAVQPPADAPPPQPPEGRDGGGIGHIPIPVLAVWLGTIVAMIYIATHDDRDRFESPD